MTSGPSAVYPSSCPTLELKDLSDVVDFDLSSVEGEVFGFEYTGTGYKKIINGNFRKIKFLQLIDIRYFACQTIN